jgi:hypothetical protein
MATKNDLWGKIVPVAQRTPVSILREQAALLGQKTKNLVEAKVETSSAANRTLVHSFTIVVPPLDYYKYELFRVAHSPSSLYPVTVRDGKERELSTEEDFIGWLGRKLSSSETIKLVQILLAQVNQVTT